MALITIDPQPDQHLADAGTRNRWPGLALTGRKVRIAVSAIALAGVLHWGVLGPLSHRIDDNADFTPPAAPEGGSAAVAMAAALIHREVNDHNWTPNDPWFAPNALFDNMPNYQHGMIRAIGRFSFEMLDQIARSRGSSSNDPDLERASGYLQFPADIWM